MKFSRLGVGLGSDLCQAPALPEERGEFQEAAPTSHLRVHHPSQLLAQTPRILSASQRSWVWEMGSIKLQLMHISLIWVAPSPLKMDLILFLEALLQEGFSLLNRTRGLGQRRWFACSHAVLLNTLTDFMLPYFWHCKSRRDKILREEKLSEDWKTRQRVVIILSQQGRNHFQREIATFKIYSHNKCSPICPC